MLSIRIVTAGAVLAFAVSAAAAQDSDTTPGQPGSLLKMFMHSSEAPASEAKTSPPDQLQAKRVAPKPIRTTRHFHHHATRVATAMDDPALPTEPAQAPAPTNEQPPTLEPATWSAQAAIDAAPPSMWPAGNAPLFAGVLDSEPQAAAEPRSSSDRGAATSNAVADTRPAPAVAAALQDNSDDSRDTWFEEILAALSGALAAGVVAWFLFGAAPQRRYG
jgi:hypothetical protein